MSDQKLSMNYWSLFKAMLRVDGSGIEKERANAACTWMNNQFVILKRNCTSEEIDLLGLVYQHWVDHKEAPGFIIIKHLLEQGDTPILEEHLRDYELMTEAIPVLTADDLPALFELKCNEYRVDLMARYLRNAQVINTVGTERTEFVGEGSDRVKVKVKIKGPEDSFHYLMNQMERGILGSNSTVSTHGTLQDDADGVWEDYEHRADPNRKDGRRIFTGIREFDRLTEMKTGMFVGLLGFAKQGKTRLARTMAYHAAEQGFNVLHFSLEQSYIEERNRYAIIHSWNSMWGRPGISLKDFENHTMSKADSDWFRHEVLPDLKEGKSLPGKLKIRQPDGCTWDAIRSQISITDREAPLDMVMVDYLALCKPKQARFWKEEVDAAIADAQNMALTFRNNDGLLFCTPVQGSRSGLADAKKEGGRWEMSGIWMHSAFEKYMDICYSVYADDDLNAEDKVILSSIFNRRGPDVPPHKAGVNHACGIFQNLASTGVVEKKILDDLLDDRMEDY